MANTPNLSLTDELRAVVDQNCGDGTLLRKTHCPLKSCDFGL